MHYFNSTNRLFEGFDKSRCRLIVPEGCSANYFSNVHFNGFLSVSEMKNGNPSIAIPQIGYVTGQYFETISESHLAESKTFCLHNGRDYCYIAMTSKGFFLKIMGGGYFFLSKLISNNSLGNIWVKNKKGSMSSYAASYTTDGITDRAFGRFTEGFSGDTLTYKDLESGTTFTLNLNTGKKVQ